MARRTRQNALLAKPPQHFHYLTRSKTYGGKQITADDYAGVHSASSFAIAAAYAHGTVTRCRCGYPVVVELDVSGLKPLPDIDAVMTAENVVHDSHAIKEAKRIVSEYDDIGSAEDEIGDSLNYQDNEDQANVGDHWTTAAFDNFSFVNIASAFRGTYPDDDQAWEAFKRYAETGEVAEEVLANLTEQRRWLHDFEAKRVIRVYTYKPIWDEILDNWWDLDDKELEKKAEAIEAAGYDIVTLETIANGSDPIGVKEVLYEKSKSKHSNEFHGTSSDFFKKAYPSIKIPAESPFPVTDPDEIEEEEE